MKRPSKYRDCVICGEQFPVISPRGMAVTCGPECGKERRRNTRDAWRPTYVARWNEIKDLDHTRQYDAEWKRRHRAANPGKDAAYARERRARLKASRHA